VGALIYPSDWFKEQQQIAAMAESIRKKDATRTSKKK